VLDKCQDAHSLEQWLKKNAKTIKQLHLRNGAAAIFRRLPCLKLQDLLLQDICMQFSGPSSSTGAEGTLSTDLAAAWCATALTSLVLQDISIVCSLTTATEQHGQQQESQQGQPVLTVGKGPGAAEKPKNSLVPEPEEVLWDAVAAPTNLQHLSLCRVAPSRGAEPELLPDTLLLSLTSLTHLQLAGGLSDDLLSHLTRLRSLKCLDLDGRLSELQEPLCSVFKLPVLAKTWVDKNLLAASTRRSFHFSDMRPVMSVSKYCDP
jgi:hypothetical protein